MGIPSSPEADRAWLRWRVGMFFRKPGQGQKAAPATPAKIPAAGAPLAADVRARMEPQLGADLSGVKVSTSGESANAAGQLGARAFTVGNEVHFGAGQYAPGTKEGDRLIAHELTHAVQGQRQGVQRKEAEGAKGEAAGLDVSQPGDAAEVEADKVADGVADRLHGQANKKGEDKQGPEAGERPNGKDHQAGDHGAGGAHSDEKPAPISAKLEGVGTKAYAARGGAAPAPAAGAGPAPRVNVDPIVGKLDQAITMFTLWKSRGTAPVADQMLAALNTAKAGAQQLKGAQERNAPATERAPMKQHLSDQLQRIQTLDPNYELFSIGNMALTVKNVKKTMEPVAVQFTCGRKLMPLIGEYRQQLQMQQDGINAQTCQSWLNNRDQFLARQAAGGTGRSSVGTQMQAEYNRRSGSGRATNTVAPHHSDQVAGGHPDPTGTPANTNVNSSIGQQWPDKIKTIDSKARAVPPIEQLFTQMNVQLTVQPAA